MGVAMKVILYICIIALFISCGTYKHSTDVNRHMFTSVSLTDSLLRKDSVLSLVQLLSNKRLHARIIVTEWSKPCSTTGKQHPIKTTEVNIDEDKTDKFVKSEQSGFEAIQMKKEDAVQIEYEKKQKDIKTNTQLISKWVWCFLFVGVLIFTLLYWQIRRVK